MNHRPVNNRLVKARKFRPKNLTIRCLDFMNQAELNITDLRDRSIAAAGDQVSNVLGDEKIILDMKSGEYFGMNLVGADIWDYIQEPRKLDEIVAVLTNKYGIDQERCEADVLALLAELSDVGLIEIT